MRTGGGFARVLGMEEAVAAGSSPDGRPGARTATALPTYDKRVRVVILVALAAPIAWQVVAVVLAMWRTAVFTRLFAGLGTELPLSTKVFLAARPFLWLVPLAFAGLSFDILRRRNTAPLYFVVVFIAAFVVALALQAWMVQAMYAPMNEILPKIP